VKPMYALSIAALVLTAVSAEARGGGGGGGRGGGGGTGVRSGGGGGGGGGGRSRPWGPRPNPRPNPNPNPNPNPGPKPDKPGHGHGHHHHGHFFYGPYDPFFYGSSFGYYGYREYREDDDGFWKGDENVQVKVSPKKAEILANGIPYGKSGRAKFNLPTGAWRIELRAEGYEPQVLELKIEPGVKYKVERKLRKLGEPQDKDRDDR
jgi:hypothetical protein